NHTLLSLEALNARKMPIVGIAFIGEENADSERTICEMGGAMHLGRLPHLSPLNEQTLRTAMVENFQSLLSKRIHA
ncbi:MAG: AAA family ATPase, partial [Pseudomonadota bacterium]